MHTSTTTDIQFDWMNRSMNVPPGCKVAPVKTKVGVVNWAISWERRLKNSLRNLNLPSRKMVETRLKENSFNLRLKKSIIYLCVQTRRKVFVALNI